MVSNGEGTTFSQSEWQHYAERFSSDQSNVKVVYIDAPHDLYHYQSNDVVSHIEEFLENN
jgi:probable hydrolase